MNPELGNHARRVIDGNRYMALGTADESGQPWVSPVWFASEDYRSFHLVSSPDPKHSRNLAAHPEVAIAIFDSSVPVGGAQAAYMKGVAKERGVVYLAYRPQTVGRPPAGHHGPVLGTCCHLDLGPAGVELDDDRLVS